MKKLLTGIFAMTLLIGLSAFYGIDSFASKKNADKVDQQPKVEVDLYWYPVQPNGTIDHNAPINTTPMTKSELRDEDLLPCDENEGEDCIRGFQQPQVSSHAAQGLEKVERSI